MIKIELATVVILAIAPTGVQAQRVSDVQLGLARPMIERGELRRDALDMRRRGTWEAGAVLGGIAGAVVGYAIVVFYNDGRAEKMGPVRTAATVIGSGAVGAGIGALLQTVIATAVGQRVVSAR